MYPCALVSLETLLPGTWKLEYDLLAAHALLCAVRGNREALLEAAKGVDRRCRQAAAFLADIPESVLEIDASHVKKVVKLSASPDNKSLNRGAVMDILFRGASKSSDLASCVLSEVVELKPVHRVDGEYGHSVSVSQRGSFKDLCSRCCSFPALDANQPGFTLNSAMRSACAWSRLGKFRDHDHCFTMQQLTVHQMR